MNKKLLVPATVAFVGVIVLSGCFDKKTETMPIEDDIASEGIMICDEYGNEYASEQEAIDAGLSEAEYGATYCQYPEKTTKTDVVVGENVAAVKKTETVTAPAGEVKKTTTTVGTEAGTVKKTEVEATPSEQFTKKEQTTGSKKHDDFVLEHVKHNDLGDKYAVVFGLDRKQDAKTHEAPYTEATLHPHDSNNNYGRIEVVIHEVKKNTFDPTKVIEPKHNKYVKDIEMVDSGHETRAKFVIHLDEKATGKFNLSSHVENNQDAFVTLDVLE